MIGLLRRRPRFTIEERDILWNMVQDEMTYLEDDAPVCRFKDEKQAGDLLAKLDANTDNGGNNG